MKFEFYIYQKIHEETSENIWIPKCKVVSSYSTFYKYFNKEPDLCKYFIKDEQVPYICCTDIYSIIRPRYPHLITLEIPFRKRKEFKLKWLAFKNSPVSEYFYIKEK